MSEVSIKPSYKILSVVVSIFTIMMGTASAVFAAFLLKAVLGDFSGLGLFIYLMFISISGVLLLGGLTNSFGIRVVADDAQFVIYCLYVFKIRYSTLELLGYKAYSHWTKYGMYQGFFIETRQGTQYAFSEFQLANYKSIESAVTEAIPSNNNLQRQLWKMLPRQFYIGILGLAVLCHVVVMLR
ncbi:hypothetical protein [Hymenobacter pini]|uniref:hypothetical protein n=1 Tax=Hymenobacter pini TaxID=2880879 RepID=UPI001CF103AC|nr:hypothetical protein [Hymenobacter pini]MCA8829023.1 hypothetical protein [Hymenobacter pini]